MLKRFLPLLLFVCLMLSSFNGWTQEAPSPGKATFGLGAGFSNFTSGRAASLSFQFRPDRSNIFYAGPSVFINYLRQYKEGDQPFNYWAADSAKRQLGIHLGWIHLFHLNFTGPKVKPFFSLNQEWYRLNNFWWRYYDFGWCGTQIFSDDFNLPSWIMENSFHAGLQVSPVPQFGIRAAGGVSGMVPLDMPELIVRGAFRMEMFVNF